jgi:hypothetical protein
VVSFTPRSLYFQGKSTRYPLDRRLGGPQTAVPDAVVKGKIPSPHRESNPRTPIVQPVAQRYTNWAITNNKYIMIYDLALSGRGDGYCEVLSGYKPGRVGEVCTHQCFEDHLCPHTTLRMRGETVLETTRLITRKNFSLINIVAHVVRNASYT